ncbi:MAG: 2-hydroxyacid dehydrogenase [Thermoplasmata archaeon]
MNILVTFPAPREKFEKLKELGNVYFMEDINDQNFLNDIDIIFVYRWHAELANININKMKNLKIIQSLLAGVDNIPFSQISDKIVLKNSGASSDVIAEHVFALILAKTRNIIFHNSSMRTGKFEQLMPAISLRGKVIGILGYGSIGKEIAKIARAFNMHVFGISRHRYPELDFNGTLEDLDYVLKSSDIVVISLPLNKYTKNIIDKNKLNLMKHNAILVNIARGNIINEKDLFEFLSEHREFTACLDVWWHYPRNETFKQDYPFESLENVIMTPHVSGIYEGYLDRMIENGIESIFRFLNGSVENVVDVKDYI